MALTIHLLDYGDIELETSFLVLGHECGRVRRVPVYGFLILGGSRWNEDPTRRLSALRDERLYLAEMAARQVH